MWRSRPSNNFKSSYKGLNDEKADRVDKAIADLLSSPRPDLLGIPKKASRKGYFAYEIGQSCRVIYRPDFETRLINFLRVCSHKEAYEP